MPGLATFSRHFEPIYGPSRWPGLLQALQAPTRHACLVNRNADPIDVGERLKPVEQRIVRIPWIRRCGAVLALAPAAQPEDKGVPKAAPGAKKKGKSAKAKLPWPFPALDLSNIKTHYLLDLASVLCVEALSVSPSDRVLDLCAAPGGKSLCILQALDPGRGGSLTANEPSKERRRRLTDVLASYSKTPKSLPPHVVVENVDATRPTIAAERFPDAFYSRVLVDAPCSSDRHILHAGGALLAHYAPSARARAAARRQLRLLLCALRACAVGGRVVYSTCALSPDENDAVVAAALARSPSAAVIATKSTVADVFGEDGFVVGEATELGWMVLPDNGVSGITSGGWGPLFFCVLEKVGIRDGYIEVIDEDGDEGVGVDDGGWDDDAVNG
ncbi:S-adenosyl-L-methionine-dependent methyltransferase [Zopfochytrium polystomum]|nr:S-adenosyl-L-methionine-dependent methyltransferase [Zopfochytrium polystomum]